MEDFTRRVSLPEASQLASLLLRNTSLGTELVGSLALQADHLRLARRQAALTEANKTPVKLIFPIMFCFAPAVLILLTAPAVMQLQDFMRDSPISQTIRRSVIAGEGLRAGTVGPTAAGRSTSEGNEIPSPARLPHFGRGTVPDLFLDRFLDAICCVSDAESCCAIRYSR